jgi:hypothetical protein
MQHVRKFGEDRIIAGDYKSFDGRMSPKFMASAFKILINIARLSGNYDSEDLEIMKGIATEICNPLYDFNGILVQVFGSNPSGHPLTVIINSMLTVCICDTVIISFIRRSGLEENCHFSVKLLPLSHMVMIM